MTRAASRQKGATLLVSLIMLVLITILAITAFRLGKGNLQIAGNMQSREQVLTDAQVILETTISNKTFTNGSIISTTTGVNTTTVVVTPTWIASQTIPPSQLDISKTEDAGCVVQASQQLGIAGETSSNSICSNQLWDLDALATDTVTNASVEIHQGVNLRSSP
jgi:Tfp pilus assembly protein PilX